jgi:uncharacterized membrane protein YeaQ/YmgE (transglycosylase-associated protein family)
MGALAITVIIAAGLVIGLGAQYLTNPRSQLEWLIVAVTTAIGAYAGSEWLTTNVFSTMVGGPEFDGLVIIPAIIAGLVLGLLGDAFTRYIALEPA